jgi:DMSO reductase anchor subunit
MRFVRSSAELVHKMRKLKIRKLIQWFISGGCHVYVLVADMDTINFKLAFNIVMWETGSVFLTFDFFANHEKTAVY